jgi:hypothetical protein
MIKHIKSINYQCPWFEEIYMTFILSYFYFLDRVDDKQLGFKKGSFTSGLRNVGILVFESNCDKTQNGL